MSQDEIKDQGAPAADAAAPNAVSQAGSPAPEAKKADKNDKKEHRALEKELEGLRAKLQGTEKDLAGAKDTLLRTAAEYDNYRKRTTREKDATFNNGVAFALTQLLPVIDALEMAAAAECADENYKKGVAMTLSRCGEALAKLNIKEIEAVGKPFDPALHSAVLQEPASEAFASGTVTKVLQKGYCIGDKVIRHATVAVAE